MQHLSIDKTQFRVADFISWQRDGSLQLTPRFQRRSVWKPDAKSYFIDTVVRGLPAPVIYIRERVDLHTQKTIREVVDGQQRLRTIFAYVDKALIHDLNASDEFVVRKIHNEDISGIGYTELPRDVKRDILSYAFSTHVLPINMEDRDILQMFARLNATGVKLNQQELRNSQYFGVCKTVMYELALGQLERWRGWDLFRDDQIARMLEVEFTSDLCYNMVEGLSGKSQAALEAFYKTHDEEMEFSTELRRRFIRTMDAVDDILGSDIPETIFRSQVYFFSLFVYLYDRLYGLGSSIETRIHPGSKNLKIGLKAKLLNVSKRFEEETVPASVLDAVRRASSDYGRRKTRYEYMRRICGS